MEKLTNQQKRVLFFILKELQATGMPPTLREIAEHFSWKAVASAQDMVKALRKKGYLHPPVPGKSRQFLPTAAASDIFRRDVGEEQVGGQAPEPLPPATNRSDILNVPLLGLVQAGHPVEVFEHTSHEIPFVVPESHRNSNSRYFAVSVKGYSMMDAGILPGDKLLIEFGAQPRNGQIVVASVESHEVTVKRYAMKGSLLYKEALQKGHLEMESQGVTPLNAMTSHPPALLVPENSDFHAIPFGVHQQDRIIGVVRSLYRSAIE